MGATCGKEQEIEQGAAEAELAFEEVGEILAGKRCVHIKGFGRGDLTPTYFDDALARIRDYDVVVWDGDPLQDGSFAQLVPQYL
eukprot:COSAG01_NODE_33546_length_562_cov_1.328294_1_plen_84_part_00